MAVWDSNYCFTLLDIGNYGRHSDGIVLSNSLFGQAMEAGSLNLPDLTCIGNQSTLIPYFFICDSAFLLKTYMMRPYRSKYLAHDKGIFNYCLSRATRIIKNAFGILTTKFRIFRHLIKANPTKVTKITQAACTLHNYLKISEAQIAPSSRLYCPPGYIDHDDRHGNLISGEWRQQLDTSSSGLHTISHVAGNRYTKSASELRDTLKNYFNSTEGAIPWQEQHVLST